MAFSKFFLPAFLACAVQAALQYKGADWSSVAVLERDGVQYKDLSGAVKPLETILVENGLNIVRQRVVRILPAAELPPATSCLLTCAVSTS